jgi:hypothetical protein
MVSVVAQGGSALTRTKRQLNPDAAVGRTAGANARNGNLANFRGPHAAAPDWTELGRRIRIVSLRRRRTASHRDVTSDTAQVWAHAAQPVPEEPQ